MKTTILVPLSVLVSGCGCLIALPEQPNVVSGDVAIAYPSADILQITASDRSIIDWGSFSISPSEMTRFLQPSSDAVVLNRVIGANLSELMGTLSANGMVYLINQNGVLIGKEGFIDTAGFVGSTLDLSNQSFLCGDLKFEGNSEQSLTLLGTIRAKSGNVHLISHHIQNEGEINAQSGTVSLTSAHEVFLKDEKFPLVQVRVDLKSGGLENKGSIEALNAILQSDDPFGVALKQEGSIRLVEEGGKILLRSTGGEIQIGASAKLQAPAGEIQVQIPDEGRPLYLLGSLDVS